MDIERTWESELSKRVRDLEEEVERLRAVVNALLEVARDVVSDSKGTLNPGLLALAEGAIAQAGQALASGAGRLQPSPPLTLAGGSCARRRGLPGGITP